ncbi:MAG TPA: crosslink repair DNA glycosylase YcaQ family protein [Candidatus Limnocylindria bacterium]|nr:crosslink repair DNA glycosylase YcaQ family protein [Candidatus Limnocylindria bacterium]
MPALEISRDHARRFLVSRHLLAPPRSLPAEPASVLTAVERLGLLQFDPLEVPGARNHDLVLHARIQHYQREWCEQWLYGPDRRLIELYNKSLNMVPIHELPHYRISWQRNAPEVDNGILKEQADVAQAILRRLRTDAPLSTAAFSEHGHAVDWWWAPTRASRAVMEALFVTGRIGIARRDGNRRYYDLIERLVPRDLLARRESEEDAMTHRLLSRYRAVGLTTPVGTQTEVMYSAGRTAERKVRTERLVAEGRLIPVDVEGLKYTRYIIAEEKAILEQTADPGSLASPAVSFLAPLDPLAWDRRMLRELWEFDYLWEVYVPEPKRRWGYYVLPMLFGDRFIGRIEPRLDRKTKTLAILGLWFEAGFAPMDEPGFIPALRDAVEAYRCFVGATKVTWPRARPGRDMASALRRLPAA